MCLCLFALNEHDEYPFILLANRDEFRNRPSAKADFWNDHSNVLGGRDLKEMGTWLGVTQEGRIAFLTNHRNMDSVKKEAPTRGKLVSEYLTSNESPDNYVNSIENPKAYNGFNLMVGTPEALTYFSNVAHSSITVTKGIHGLSNALLDTSWPKVDSGKEQLTEAISDNKVDLDNLFEILSDPKEAQDKNLPETGIGLEWERKLSSRFINMPTYGTVCSTVILVNRKRELIFEERTFSGNGQSVASSKHQFAIK